MTRRSLCRSMLLAASVAVACGVAPALAMAHKKSSHKTLTVCKHGCVYTRIQAAVNASGRGATIRVKPGKYVEGVIVSRPQARRSSHHRTG